MRKSPFPFIFDELSNLNIRTKPMFGCEGIYVDQKIVFICRLKDDHVVDNGVWLATTAEHHKSLQKDFPEMRSIELFGPGPTGWQNLPVDSPHFEESVLRACQFVIRNDSRIGKVPKKRAPPKKSGQKKSPAKKRTPQKKRR